MSEQGDDFLNPPDVESGEGLEIHNAADPKAIKNQRRKQLSEADQSKNFWRVVMGTEVGRREIWKLIAYDMHAFEDRFACGPNGFPQPDATMFQAGEKACGQRLYFMLMRMDREGIGRMHDENDPAYATPKRGRAQTSD